MVAQIHIKPLGVFHDVVPILVHIRGVDHQEEMLLRKAVDQQIVHDTALLVWKTAVLNLSWDELTHIVGRYLLKERQGIRAFDEKFAHVAYVKHSSLLTHCSMLMAQTAVLYGHIVAGKRHHLRAQRDVYLLKCC